MAHSELRALQRIYRKRVPFDKLTTAELTRAMCDVSHLTGRQVGVLVDRSGSVDFVVVGDSSKIMLPDFGRLRAAKGRFRGLRLIHTHLHKEPLTRDDLVDLTLLRLDMIAAICVSPAGQPQQVYYAHCIPASSDLSQEPFEKYGPVPYGQLQCNPSQIIPALEEEFARHARTHQVKAKDGRAVIVQVAKKKNDRQTHDRIYELKELARTAGVEVMDTVQQFRPQPDPKYLIGKGKLEDIVLRAMQLDAEVLIFDHDLSPAQSTAIARRVDLKIIDRTQLILDVFAQHAEGRDGKLQVELAQMRYLLPRLGTKDDALSRLTGGIGGRGPGETKLEIGRRRARERIDRLEKQLKLLAKQRVQRRSRRDRRGIPVVAVVGYTNAGKSTLLNALTNSDVRAEDKLFATLDTRSRRIRFPRERELVVTDTVGFIRNLPKELFAAFRATFEEAQDADLLIHVIDASDAAHKDHIETTEKVLGDLDLLQVPRLMVYNKIDQLNDPAYLKILQRSQDAIAVCALDRDTLTPLLEKIEHMLWDHPQHGQVVGLGRGMLPHEIHSSVDAQDEGYCDEARQSSQDTDQRATIA